jgi:hypothetical protein
MSISGIILSVGAFLEKIKVEKIKHVQKHNHFRAHLT